MRNGLRGRYIMGTGYRDVQTATRKILGELTGHKMIVLSLVVSLRERIDNLAWSL